MLGINITCPKSFYFKSLWPWKIFKGVQKVRHTWCQTPSKKAKHNLFKACWGILQRSWRILQNSPKISCAYPVTLKIISRLPNNTHIRCYYPKKHNIISAWHVEECCRQVEEYCRLSSKISFAYPVTLQIIWWLLEG